jgi:NTE family protein
MNSDMAKSQGDGTIGLCFSGGGFRASFYALGVARYLAEAGLLERTVAVSAVSGGSIAAAAMADRWSHYVEAGGGLSSFNESIDTPFRTAVTSSNLRRRWMVGSLGAAVPFTGGRGGAYARTLAHNLYEHRRLADLPTQPEFIFTSTDLSKGRAFRVAPAYIGSWDYGYIAPTPTSIKLGEAVAASAAFPPSLTVVNLKTSKLRFPKASPASTLSLVDGGVYDNLGLEWFQGWQQDAQRPSCATKPTFTIVANASGLLAEKSKRFSPVGAFRRDLAIQYQQSLSLRVRWYLARLKAEPGSGVYMAIKSDPRSEGLPGELTVYTLPSELVKPLALLRTDLDRFSLEEADLLSYHAYWTLHVRLSVHASHLAMADPSWKQFANLPPSQIDRLRGLLEIGSHRFLRRVRKTLPRGGAG